MSGKAKSTNQEIQMISKWRSRALAFAVFLGASASAMAQNAIQSIDSTQRNRPVPRSCASSWRSR